MKNKWLIWLSSIPSFLLLPYLCVFFMQGRDCALGTRAFQIEEFIPIIIEQQISPSYELETFKAQAVIARSNLYYYLSEQSDLLYVIAGFIEREAIASDRGNLWQKNVRLAAFSKKAQRSANETKGKVMQYEGKWKRIPYHEISNGQTRDGSEVFHSSEYDYLKAVDSKADVNAEKFLSSVCVPIKQMPVKIEVLERDSSGYVLCLSANGNPIEGESFREGMHLASTDVTIQKMGDQYCFWCRGKGHGLGLSQYGANELAKEGESYKNILKTYFPKLELCELKMEIDEIEKNE